ncbi:fibrobacter succinogenes major paralogous domain-containing protein [soil metagenome]
MKAIDHIQKKFILLFIMVSFLFAGSCKKEIESKPVVETGTMTDIDNNVYQTVKIGNQWWMAENLKVTRYRDGGAIALIQNDTSAWRSDTNGVYCLYEQNAAAPGYLYNGYALNNAAELAPEGWHIPNDAEWKELEMALGMESGEADKFGWRSSNVGDMLKVKGPIGWTRYGEVWGSNESGFSGLAGSCRLYNGIWGDPGLFATGFWWVKTNFADDQSFYRYLDYKSSAVFRSHVSKSYGMSIRCIKDY